MQLMHGRLLAPPGNATPASAAGWGPGGQQRVAAEAVLQSQQQILLQQQQYEQQLQQQLLAQRQYEQQQLEELRYQQLLLQRQQQQAEADAFPDITPGFPDWQLAGASPAPSAWGLQLQQQHLLGHAPVLPLFPGREACAAGSGVMASGGNGRGWVQQPHQQHPSALQQGGRQVDEFGVPLEPSISDDESEANAACGQASVAAPAADHQPRMLHQLVLQPGQGLISGAALGQPSGLAAEGQADGGSAGGQMAAFLNSRSRDFAVPRIGKPLGSRQLTPRQGLAGGTPGLAPR